MKRNLLFIFVLMIVPFTVKAQIKGVVCDENQNPVEFANVILMGADSVYIAGAVTDASGKFDFLPIMQKQSFYKFPLSDTRQL